MSVNPHPSKETKILIQGIRSYLGQLLWFEYVNFDSEPKTSWKPVMIISVSEESELILNERRFFAKISFYVNGEIMKIRVCDNHQFHTYFKLDDPRTKTEIFE